MGSLFGVSNLSFCFVGREGVGWGVRSALGLGPHEKAHRHFTQVAQTIVRSTIPTALLHDPPLSENCNRDGTLPH